MTRRGRCGCSGCGSRASRSRCPRHPSTTGCSWRCRSDPRLACRAMPTTYDVRGHQLHVLRRGEGEPLLLIQGMSGNHLAWGEPFLSDLEKDFDVVTYDHRGIGLSEFVSEPFSIADLADDAAGVLDAMGF